MNENIRWRFSTIPVGGLLVIWSLLGLALGQEPLNEKREPQGVNPQTGSLDQTEPADDTIYSGPQVGEALPTFKFCEFLINPAGAELDLVEQAGNGPIVLIFVHEVNRLSISMTRILSDYTRGRQAEGLTTGVIFLDDDLTAAESTIKRIRHALASNVPTGIAIEGREGPGSYGLNRNVMLTILVGKEQRVTGSFALVQPSLQVDLPIILESVVQIIGGDVPKLHELAGEPNMTRSEMSRSGGNRATPPASAPNLRPLLAPLIRRDADDVAVETAAQAVEDRAAADPAVRKELMRIARTIVESGNLKNYGTPKAQEFLQTWAIREDKENKQNQTDGTSENQSGQSDNDHRNPDLQFDQAQHATTWSSVREPS